jgi:hypothetical protein
VSCRILGRERKGLEEYLLNKELAGLEMHLCAEITRVCAPHEVSAAGEL